MKWYWIALILGAGVAPWVTFGQTLKIAFLRGPIHGFGVWFGIALLTTPVIFAIMGMGQLILG